MVLSCLLPELRLRCVRVGGPFVMIQQVCQVSARAHLQPLRDPLQGHRRFRQQLLPEACAPCRHHAPTFKNVSIPLTDTFLAIHGVIERMRTQFMRPHSVSIRTGSTARGILFFRQCW